jgi:hypothetical protein
MPQHQALGREAAPNRYIAGIVGARKAIVRQNELRRGVSAAQRAATTEARKAEAKERLLVLGQRLMRLEEKLLPPVQERVERCRTTVEERKRTFDDARERLLALPRAARGFFASHRPVLLVGVAVVVFDGAVLHGILEYSGMTSLTVWLTSATVPMAVGAANHGLGVLAGAIGLRVSSRHRLKLAAALFVAGMGALVVAFVLLTGFRVEAANAQNEALRALADGDAGAQLTFFISPVWMGPLQIAGSFAAITMTALWTMAKEGRDFRALVVEPARTDWHQAEADLRDAERDCGDVEQRIEQTHQELETAALAEHQVEADGRAALVEADVADDALAAALDSEDELAKAMQARYEATEQYYDRIYRNGGVWRVAMATQFRRFRRPSTLGAIERRADERPEPEQFQPGLHIAGASRNGHHDDPLYSSHMAAS